MSETATQIERQAKPAEAQVINLESYRLARRNRLLGRLAIKAEQRLLNNDALAPVLLWLESGAAADQQIRLEYRGDMSERSGVTDREGRLSDERPFQTILDYQLVDGELVYAQTGKLLSEILVDGEAAAQDDYSQRPDDYAYHLERARVLTAHGPLITEWLNSGPEAAAVVSSLAPPDSELEPRLAKLGNFKPGRQMASMWVMEPVAGGLKMHIFSMDNMTLEKLQHVYDALGADIKVKDTTMSELAEIRQLDIKSGSEVAEKLRKIHDARLDIDFPQDAPHHHGIKNSGQAQIEAYKLVEAKPEAEELHMLSVKGVAESLQRGKTTPELTKLIMDLRRPFTSGNVPKDLQISGRLELAEARDLMDYLRRKAISEYIFGDQKAHAKHYYDGDSTGGVAAAGSHSESSGTSRDGDCPTSGNSSAAAADNEAAQAMGVHQKNNENARENWVWRKGVCLTEKCPSRPAKTEVGPCSLCHKCQDIYDAGRDPNKVYGYVSIIDLLLESIDRAGQESRAKHDQEKAIKLARQKALEAQQEAA